MFDTGWKHISLVFVSVSADQSIVWTDIEKAQIRNSILKAHNVPIQTCSRLDSTLIATGDENGCLKIWDERKLEKATKVFSDHSDYVSSICYLESKKTLLSCGGDGFLYAYDIRKPGILATSDSLDSEILCSSLIQDGSINIFEWDYWGEPINRLLGHSSSVDSMVIIDDERGVVATGGGDGLLRYAGVNPNRLIGWSLPGRKDTKERFISVDEEDVGDDDIDILENERESWPISSLSISADKKWLAGASQENVFFEEEHRKVLTMRQEKGKTMGKKGAKKRRRDDGNGFVVEKRRLENETFLIDLLEDD